MKYRTYKVSGTAISQDWIVKNRIMIEEHTRDDMRIHGFIPTLDLPTDLKWEWDQDTDTFKYEIGIPGKYVGKSKAKRYIGILNEAGLVLTKDGKQVELAEELVSA
jgi:hypothetical protein